jgi:hypothetical protein
MTCRQKTRCLHLFVLDRSGSGNWSSASHPFAAIGSIKGPIRTFLSVLISLSLLIMTPDCPPCHLVSISCPSAPYLRSGCHQLPRWRQPDFIRGRTNAIKNGKGLHYRRERNHQGKSNMLLFTSSTIEPKTGEGSNVVSVWSAEVLRTRGA